MKKLLFLVIVSLFTNFSFGQTFSVSLDITGHYYIHNHNQVSVSVIKYRPVGTSTYTVSSWPTAYFWNYIYKLDPFIEWEFDINNGQSVLVTNHNFAGVSKPIGYTYDFESNNVVEGWRGYHAPYTFSTTGIYNGDDGTNKFIRLNWSSNGHASLVSPKLNNLSNDKKVSFWIRKTNNNSNILPLQLEFGTISNPYDQNTFHLLKTEVVTSDTFYKVTVYMDNYNGVDNYFIVRGKERMGGEIEIDNFSYEQSVHCTDIANLRVTNLLENSATVSFDANSNQNLWEVELKNLINNSVTTLTVNQPNYTLQNLTGNTNYQIRVRAKCDVDHFSNWSAIANFATPCTLISAGYSTSFGEQSYYIDPCWKTLTNATNIYQGPVLMPVTVSPRTGSRMIEMISGMNYDTNKKSYLITPYVQDLDNNKRIKFFLIGSGNYINNSLTIGTMSDPADSNTFIPLKTILPTEMNEINGYKVNSYWKEHIVYLDNYNLSNNHNYIAIKQNFEDDGNFFIDDFTYENIPTCKEPTNLTTLKTEYNFVKLTWDNYQNSASEWQLEYGPRGFTPGTGTSVNVTSIPFMLNSNLNASAEYDFYVRSKCGSIYSNWSDRGSFKTRCEGLSVGAVENFENDVFATTQNCWRRLVPEIRDSFYNGNTYVTTVGPTSVTAHSGSKSILHRYTTVYYTTETDKKTIFVTPRLIDFNNYKTISFWAYVPNSGNSSPVNIEIGTLSNPDDYMTFSPYKTISITTNFGQWQQITVDFPDYRRTDEFIGIRQTNSNSNGYVFYIDDFQYNQLSCPKPTTLLATQQNAAEVMLSWQDNNTAQITQNWDIEYGPIGFTPGSGTVITGVTNPYVLTNLNVNTKYGFRVKNNCDATNSSQWSEVYNFKVGCVVMAPFEENFDQYPATNAYNISNFCWGVNDGINSNIYGGVSTFSLENFNSAPNVGYLYNSSTAKQAYLSSPFLGDFNNTKRVKFWLNMSSSNNLNQSLWIGTMTNPLDYSTFQTYQQIDLSNMPVYGKEIAVDFSNYQGTNKIVAFRLSGDNYSSKTIYFDDFKYMNQNNCLEPINVQFFEISHNSAKIKWNNTNGATVQIEYGPEGFIQGSGQTVTTTTNEIVITNLTQNTNYSFYFKTLCTTSESITIGPKFISTSCSPTILPWEERFDQMALYGVNRLPNCMEVLYGGLQSYSSPVTIYTSYYNYAGVLTGNGDTSFLWLKTGHPFFTTPSFQLTAGVSYKVSLDARKSYQYDSQGILISVGRGRYTHYMEADLMRIGTLSEYNYNTNSFVFTPLENGIYTFIVRGLTGSADNNMIMDNFKFDESYNLRIGNPVLFDFESGIPTSLIAESMSNALAQITTISGNKKLLLKGGTTALTGVDFNNTSVWKNNQSSISKLNFKVNTPSAASLFLKFDLKQTFVSSNNESLFRVIVNGNQIGEVIKPQTNNSDAFVRLEYDLTAYANSDIYISLQHIGKSGSTSGDNAIIDNVEITTTLSQNDFDFNSLKVYPNPTKDFVTIESTDALSKIEVINISGQVLFTSKTDDKQFKLDLSSYKDGVYFVRIQSDEKQKTIKIVKN